MYTIAVTPPISLNYAPHTPNKSSLLFVSSASTSFNFCLISFSSTEALYWQLLVHPARLSLINIADSGTGAVAQPMQLTQRIYYPGRKDNRINQWDAAIGLRWLTCKPVRGWLVQFSRTVRRMPTHSELWGNKTLLLPKLQKNLDFRSLGTFYDLP